MNIRVFVYDDNKDRRESLKALINLNEDMLWVGEEENCRNVIADAEASQPDVILMDINMPLVNGIEGLIKIKSQFPQIKVLMQTAFDDSEKIFTSIKNGASGYILKRDKPYRILQAIEEVHQGGAAMNPGIAQKVLDYFSPAKLKSVLTKKESEVLRLLSQGLSYKMVADEMSISYTTVNSHAKNIYQKLHISSLGEAIAWYYKNQI